MAHGNFSGVCGVSLADKLLLPLTSAANTGPSAGVAISFRRTASPVCCSHCGTRQNCAGLNKMLLLRAVITLTNPLCVSSENSAPFFPGSLEVNFRERGEEI